MKRFALIGKPVAHSLSPVLHAYLLKKLDEAGRYERHEVNEAALARTISTFKRNGFVGFNVTIPHKRTVIDFLTHLDRQAGRIGAVNTVRIVGNELYGYNTDGVGFIKSLSYNGVRVCGTQALLLGAGGAARAIAYTLLSHDLSELYIANRTVGRGEMFVRELQESFPLKKIQFKEWTPESLSECAQGCQLVVNATPVGMWPDVETPPFNLHFEASGRVVSDLIYNPLRTKFLDDAARRGAVTIDGLDMFIFQAIESLRIWLGREVEVDVFELRNFLIAELSQYEKY